MFVYWNKAFGRGVVANTEIPIAAMADGDAIGIGKS